MVRIFSSSLLFLCALCFTPDLYAEGRAGAPHLRLRLGMNMLNFTVGEVFEKRPLGELLCFNPTVLWSFPSFRAMMGFHYVGDFGSKYGATPISGIGIASYFYPFGLSTAYEIANDGTLFQKSKPGPYVFGKLTPVNFNLNATKEQSPSGSAISFSAYMIETMLGAGYDYPLAPNKVLALDFQYRFASAQEKVTKNTISYSGLGLMLTFATSYH